MTATCQQCGNPVTPKQSKRYYSIECRVQAVTEAATLADPDAAAKMEIMALQAEVERLRLLVSKAAARPTLTA